MEIKGIFELLFTYLYVKRHEEIKNPGNILFEEREVSLGRVKPKSITFLTCMEQLLTWNGLEARFDKLAELSTTQVTILISVYHRLIKR
jgi:hypothetical protein